jgi:anti-anti-sigma factor
MMESLKTRLIYDPTDTWVLELIGSVDRKSVNVMGSIEGKAIAHQLIQAQAKKLVIDLAATERLDSQGLQFFLILQNLLAGQQTEIVLRNPNPHLMRILRIMQFDRLFEIAVDR